MNHWFKLNPIPLSFILEIILDPQCLIVVLLKTEIQLLHPSYSLPIRKRCNGGCTLGF